MNKNDLLKAASIEIDQLRRTNEILSAKVSTLNSCMTLLHARPPEGFPNAFSHDIRQLIEKELARDETPESL